MINMPHISMLFVAIGGLLLICLVMLIIILRLRQEHQHLKAEIAKTHDNLEQIIAARTLMLRQAGQAVSESIDYASKLQRGLLPSLDALEDAFGKVTVFWQPKDVVGGNFYWSGQMGTARVLVVMVLMFLRCWKSNTRLLISVVPEKKPPKLNHLLLS